MKNLITIFLTFSCCFCVLFAQNPKPPESAEEALRMLDREVGKYTKYEQLRQSRIDSMKADADSSARNSFLIAEANRKFKIDSALMYYRRAQNTALVERNDSMAMLAKLRYLSLLPASGYFSEAERIFDSIDPAPLSKPMKIEYYKAGNQLYFYASTSVSNRELANEFARRGSRCTDSLMVYLEPGTIDYLFYSAERNILKGNRSIAIADISEILSKCEETNDYYAIAASMAAYYYSEDDATPDRKIMALARSAISDIKSGRHEMTALQELGKYLYSEGDVARADRYLQLALEMTLKSGARLRIIESADLLPVISRSAQAKAEAKTGILWAMILLLVLALGIILWLLIRVYRSRAKLLTAQQNLADSISVRDQHIKNILNLSNECLNRLEDFNRVALRKIKANQINELLEMMQSRKIVRDEFAKFLDRFDDTFLTIYPKFVSQLNDLMQPDKQYSLTSSRSLTPEL